MTDAQLDAIEARWARATKGPWVLEVTSDGWYVGRESGREDPYDGGGPIVREPLGRSQPRKGEGTLEDGYCIAAAPTDIAALLAEVRRLKYELEELELQLGHEAFDRTNPKG